jgi:hypothetical protein
MKIDMHTHFVAPEFVEQARRGQAIGGITIENRDGKEWVVHPQGFGYPACRVLGYGSQTQRYGPPGHRRIGPFANAHYVPIWARGRPCQGVLPRNE